MYSFLLHSHSIFRWLVLLSLVWAILRAYTGYRNNRRFTTGDNALRHWTATIGHTQLIIGILLYIKSPLVQFYWRNDHVPPAPEITFFSLIHAILMVLSVIILTIGSALAKRKTTEREQFRTMFIWFSVALLIIFVAIPWPFSPLAHRPYFRTF